jgi:hypothetical protein
MAGGHVNRVNRPNTWLHRPAMRRKDFPCQLGAVHTWRKAAVSASHRFIRRWLKSRRPAYVVVCLGLKANNMATVKDLVGIG